MRALDRPPPIDPYPDHPTAGPIASRLRLAVERLPHAPYLWDDGSTVWDSTDPQAVWDAPFIGAGMTDAVCDFQALTIEAGDPDEHGLYPSARLEVSLDNRSGIWSLYGADGSLAFYAPGRRVECWALADPDDPEPDGWWLFAGRVARWDEGADGSVTIEAFDGLSILAQPLGHPWTPGPVGEAVAARLDRIATTASYPPDPRRLDPSTLALLAPESERSPLEEMQVSGPFSDGGVLFVDADGTLTYRDRSWPAGRPDQTSRPAFTDNLCDSGAVVVWELEAGTSDEAIANTVTLTNAAEPPVTVTFSDPDPLFGPPLLLTHPDPDLWQSTTDGEVLAQVLLHRATNRATSYTFKLYPTDQRSDLWPVTLDRRLGDLVKVVRSRHTVDGEATLDLDLIVTTIRHEITPTEWVATVATGKAIAYHVPQLWDQTPFTWDDPDPRNVWSY